MIVSVFISLVWGYISIARSLNKSTEHWIKKQIKHCSNTHWFTRFTIK